MKTVMTSLRLGLFSLGCAVLTTACQEPASTPAAATPAAADVAVATPAPAGSLIELNATDRQVVLLPNGLCNLERIGKDLLGSSQAHVATNPSNLVMHGWIGDEATNQAPQNPVLMVRQIGGARVWQMPLELSVKRADVAKYKNSAGLESTGFAMPADFSALPVGSYRMLLVHDRDGGRYACDNGRNIQIQG